jgi:sarcosine oxidase/L-pipecolate oxidase
MGYTDDHDFPKKNVQPLKVNVSRQTASVCVIGAGIIGSWTALHLAEAGIKTTLIEQFPLPHTRGSSHGMSRAFRLLGELELGRLDYSLERWQSLEKTCGETLFVKTGLLNFGTPGDAELEKFMAVLRNNNRPFEWLDATTIAQRYPMLKYPSAWGAAWDPNGGILFAHRCLNAVQTKFKALGGRIMTGRVEALNTASETSVNITMRSNISDKTEKMHFGHAVVCAGPWTAKLLPQLEGLLSSLLTPVTYWRDPTGSYSAANGLPILFNARLTGIYGLPSCEYPGLVKMLYHGGPASDPNNRDKASFEPFVEKVRQYVAEHLPQLIHDKPAILETCMYTMTPDSTPIIDRVEDRLVVGCGFSGSGFKHAPATGKMLAALTLGQEASIPANFGAFRYRLNRF